MVWLTWDTIKYWHVLFLVKKNNPFTNNWIPKLSKGFFFEIVLLSNYTNDEI